MKIVKYFTLIIFLIPSFVFAADCPKNIVLIIVDGAGFNRIEAFDYYRDGKKLDKPDEFKYVGSHQIWIRL